MGAPGGQVARRGLGGRWASRHDLSTRLATLDERIARLEAKGLVANGQAKASLETTLADVRARRLAFSEDAASIGYATPTDWNATKARLDVAFTELKDRVDKAG